MLQKLLILLFFLLLFSFVVLAEMSSSTINWISRRQGDSRYCTQDGNCSLDYLTVNNMTVNTTIIVNTTSLTNTSVLCLNESCIYNWSEVNVTTLENYNYVWNDTEWVGWSGTPEGIARIEITSMDDTNTYNSTSDIWQILTNGSFYYSTEVDNLLDNGSIIRVHNTSWIAENQNVNTTAEIQNAQTVNTTSEIQTAQNVNTTSEIYNTFTGSNNISFDSTSGFFFLNMTCELITGSPDLCDGSDDGVGDMWTNASSWLTPNATYGTNVNVSGNLSIGEGDSKLTMYSNNTHFVYSFTDDIVHMNLTATGNVTITGNIEIAGCLIYNGGTLGTCL